MCELHRDHDEASQRGLRFCLAGCAVALLAASCSARQSAKPEITALDASWDASTDALAAQDVAADVSSPESDAGPNVEERPVPAGFRERVLFEIEQILGGAPLLKQDAIYAAYLKHGWRPGTHPTKRQYALAYRQARAWGFDIGAFRRRGQTTVFRLSDLAEGPLPPRSPPRRRHAHEPMPQIRIHETEEPEKQTPPMPTRSVASRQRSKRGARITHLDVTVGNLDRAIDQLTRKIAELEQRARASRSLTYEARQQRTAELTADIARLEQELAADRQALRRTQQQLQQLRQ